MNRSRTNADGFADGAGISTKPIRITVLTAHPIQYQAPLFRKLAATPRLDLTVLFCSAAGAEEYLDEGFGQTIRWNRPLLDGYRSEVLRNFSPWPSLSRITGLMNFGIINKLRSARCDILLIHGWAHVTTWMAIAVAILRRIPIVLRAETTTLGEPTMPNQGLRSRVLKFFFARVSLFLATGSRSQDFYTRYGVSGKRIRIAPYAVDNEFFMSEASRLKPLRATILAEISLPSDAPVIVFSGKLIARKRPQDLLLAYLSLSARLKASLVFIGDGELRQDIERFANVHGLTNVRVTGFCNQADISKYYAVADVMVLPSEHETWGLVINEAMCFGIPIVASEGCSAATDLVHSRRNGYTFPVGDAMALGQVLQEILIDPIVAQEMGRVSQQIIREWSYEQDIDVILSGVEEMITEDAD